MVTRYGARNGRAAVPVAVGLRRIFAKNILTTEAIVAEVPEKEAAGAPGGGILDMSGMDVGEALSASQQTER